MPRTALTLDEIFDIEAEFSPLLGCRSSVFLDPAERLRPGFTEDYFVGRERELIGIAEASESSIPIIAISGVAGVGKTTLLRKFVKREKGFPYLFFEGSKHRWKKILEEVTAYINPLVSRHPAKRKIIGEPDLICRADAFSDKPVLLIFDDFDQADSHGKREFLEIAQKLESLHPYLGRQVIAVVSSRAAGSTYQQSFGTVFRFRLIEIPPFSPSDGRELIKQSAKRRGFKIDRSLINVMVEVSMGVPAVLESLVDTANGYLDRHSPPKHNRIEVKHFCEALEQGFRVQSWTDYNHLKKLKPVQHEVIGLLAQFQLHQTIRLEQILRQPSVRKRFSEQQLTWAIRRLEDDINVVCYDKGEKSVTLTEPVIFAYARLLEWRNQKCDTLGLEPLNLLSFIDLAERR